MQPISKSFLYFFIYSRKSCIRVILEADGHRISLDTINNILKSEGFAPLPKRTRQERLEAKIPPKIEAPESVPLGRW